MLTVVAGFLATWLWGANAGWLTYLGGGVATVYFTYDGLACVFDDKTED